MGMRKLLLIFLLGSFSATSQPMSKLISKHKVSCDIDAQKFIDSTAITGTEATAICNLVKQLKDSSLWSSISLLYPFVGASSTSFAFNLKDPATYKLTFSGTATYTSAGYKPDGSTGYANTNFVPLSLQANYNTHYATWSTTDIDEPTGGVNLGSANGSFGRWVNLQPRTGNIAYAASYNNGAGFLSVANTNSVGLFVNTCISSSDFQIYKNNASIAISTTPSSDLPQYSLYIGALNKEDLPFSFSTRNLITVSVGNGLTSGQVSTFYNIFNTFKTALGR